MSTFRTLNSQEINNFHLVWIEDRGYSDCSILIRKSGERTFEALVFSSGEKDLSLSGQFKADSLAQVIDIFDYPECSIKSSDQYLSIS